MYITNIKLTPPTTTLTSTCTYGILSFSLNNNNYNLLSTLFLRITRNEIAAFSLPHRFLILDRSLSRYFASFSSGKQWIWWLCFALAFWVNFAYIFWSILNRYLDLLVLRRGSKCFFFLFIPQPDLYFVPALYLHIVSILFYFDKIIILFLGNLFLFWKCLM